ncbi:MAG: M48 family metalloprotease [Alphaproteobacteria bacterium]|nr:M48 family metalloprotease [Alphaproteobacteria bacterium]
MTVARPALHLVLCGLLAIAAAGGLVGCAQNAATGRSQFTAFVSPEEEAKIGREQHPQVLAEFGGAYDNPKVAAYVQRVGETLVARSELKGQPFRFTVINSDIYNAFALPGGYVYITRGLLALMSSEAELASVLGHEIGHVTARHTAERISRTQAANIFSSVLGIGVAVLTGSGDAGNLAAQATGSGAAVWLAGFSREQEFEADKLGVRYMAADGYDPREAAEMLSKLGDGVRLSVKELGRPPESADEFSIMQSHPRTADRVVAATDAARAQGMVVAANPRIGEDAYFDAIDGMAFGGDAESGFVRGNVFTHPKLRFRFEAPKGFRIVNGEDAVRAMGPDNSSIKLDAKQAPRGVEPADFLVGVWAKGVRLQNVERIQINGLAAATGALRMNGQKGPVDVRLVAIKHPDGAYFRMMFVVPAASGGKFNEDFRRATYSFRALTEAEARAAEPLRIRFVTVRPGDTQASIAQRMATKDGFDLERFRIYNGLKADAPLVPGSRVKIIADR